MKSNRIYMRKASSLLAIVTVLFSIYVLAKTQSLRDLVAAGQIERKQNGRLAKLEPPCSSMSGTVLDVTGRFVIVQAANRPHTISMVCINGGIFAQDLRPVKPLLYVASLKKVLLMQII